MKRRNERDRGSDERGDKGQKTGRDNHQTADLEAEQDGERANYEQ